MMLMRQCGRSLDDHAGVTYLQEVDVDVSRKGEALVPLLWTAVVGW